MVSVLVDENAGKCRKRNSKNKINEPGASHPVVKIEHLVESGKIKVFQEISISIGCMVDTWNLAPVLTSYQDKGLETIID